MIDFSDGHPYIRDMTDETPDPIAAALKAKLADILYRKKRNDEQKAAVTAEEHAIDRDLADLRAGARVLNIDLDIPKSEDEDRAERLRTMYRLRSIRQKTREKLGDVVHITRADDEEPPSPHRPPIKEIVLNRLREAGDKGTRAVQIRQYIERVYGGNIHEKTVGMTLYRLSNKKLVARKGHTWFLARPEGPETRNPGAATPGSESSSERKEEM